LFHNNLTLCGGIAALKIENETQFHYYKPIPKTPKPQAIFPQKETFVYILETFFHVNKAQRAIFL